MIQIMIFQLMYQFKQNVYYKKKILKNQKKFLSLVKNLKIMKTKKKKKK